MEDPVIAAYPRISPREHIARLLGGINHRHPIIFNGEVRSVADVLEELRQNTEAARSFVADIWREQK